MFKQEKKYYIRAFVYALIMATVLLLPFVIIDGGFFVYYGDYDVQQIPFYKTCIRAVQSGNFGWNWQTDLGVNLIGSYSFYTLGSPFFWFAALFPVEISQYLMAPLLALKIALASFFAFVYIRRFVTKPQNALIGGLLYAFSGYSMYNIFFNHFHEAIAFFPLLLIGLEEVVVNRRRGAFAVAVAINAFVNYFFFIGECVFLLLYFFARVIGDPRFRIRLRDFFCLAFESICGVLIAGALFVPSIFQVLDVPRSTQTISDEHFLFYSPNQIYGLILESMFFPGEVPARSRMFTEANAKWSSVAFYLPLFSLSGVIALIKGAGTDACRRMKWARILFPVCLLFVFVPGLNSSFVLFNPSFYTRWFYMPELLCAMATVYVLEHAEFDLKFGAKACASVVAVMTLLVTLYPTTKVYETVQEGRQEYLLPNMVNGMFEEVSVNVALSVIMLILLFVLLKFREKLTTAKFTRRATAFTIVCCMALGYYFTIYGRILGPYIGSYNKIVSTQIHIDDPEFYRIEESTNFNNINMIWDMSSLKSFTSIIPSSTFELYELLGIERTVNSDPSIDRYALRSLTHVKYLIVDSTYEEDYKTQLLNSARTYRYLETQDGYDIYENTQVLPMGFAYDGYVLYEDVKGLVDNLMIESVILTEEQAEKYGDILTKNTVVELSSDELYDKFLVDVEERKSMGAKQFSVNNSCFTAVTDYDRERFVMFSVPFDNGWSGSVSVDGGEYQPLELEKVNGGFIGVKVPAGVCELKFTYSTPGGTLGVICTVMGVVLFGGYILLCYVILRHRPRRYAHLYPVNQVEGVKAHSSYIGQLSKQIYESPEKGAVQLHSEEEQLSFPDIEESFMDRERYDFKNRKPKPRNSHITEDDEAYNVMKELDEQRSKKDDIE